MIFTSRNLSIVRLPLAALFITGLVYAAGAQALPAPTGQQAITPYTAIANPVVAAAAESSRPVAVGAAADGSGDFSLQVQTGDLQTPMDAYFGIVAQPLAPSTIFLLGANDALVPFTGALVPWKTNMTSLDASPFGALPLSAFPDGTYSFYLLLSATGQDPFQSDFFLWATTLTVGNGTIIETYDPAMPFMTLGANGMLTTFHVDPVSGEPTGMTFLAPDGQSAYLATDAATGLPDHLVADGYILVFSNIRVSDGLLDLGVIYPDGSDAFIEDLAFEGFPSTATAKAFKATDPVISSDRSGEQRRQKFLKLYGAFDATMKVTGCIVGAIVTAGGAVAGSSTAAAPPVSFLFFNISASAGATTLACGTALIAFMSLKAEHAEAVDLTNDMVTKKNLVEASVGCAGKSDLTTAAIGVAQRWLECVKMLAEAVSWAKSSFVNKVYGTYLRLRDGRAALKAPFKVYCCTGPDQIRVGKWGDWRAAVVEGLGQPPFLFDFDFGDGGEFSRPSLLTTEYGVTFPYSYETTGTYTLGVTVTDDTDAQAVADTEVTGARKPFTVEVYDALALQCCTANDAPANNLEMELKFSVTGGRKPFSYSVGFRDGTTAAVGKTINSSFTVSLLYAILSEPKDILVEVTDADGTIVRGVHQVGGSPNFQVNLSGVKRVSIQALFNITQYNYVGDTSYYGTGGGNVVVLQDFQVEDGIHALTSQYENISGSSWGGWIDVEHFSFTLNSEGNQVTAFKLTGRRDYQSDSQKGEYDTWEFSGSGAMPLTEESPATLVYEIRGNAVCDLVSKYGRKDYRKKSWDSDGMILYSEASFADCNQTQSGESYVRVYLFTF